jgi:methyl-accepting chemotaxis protein
MIVTCLASILGLVINFTIIATRRTKPVRAILQGLAARAREISAGSAEMGEASDAMSHGSAIQSATIEETSSSLEEILSMTKHNSERARVMNHLVDDTTQIISRMSTFMRDLTNSMDEINKASQETSKIIKTIDEIAFQTNLLALNAAVEAARAGASGAGFAVVAGEVRSLAMRSAEAAKNTADLIESTVKKIKAGSEIVVKTNQEFNEVATRSSKMGVMIAEITTVSQKQEQGIEQISSSIHNMDQIIEQNMAHADEVAAIAEDTTQQAETIMQYIRRMAPLVGLKSASAKPMKLIRDASPERAPKPGPQGKIGTAAPVRSLPAPKK